MQRLAFLSSCDIPFKAQKIINSGWDRLFELRMLSFHNTFDFWFKHTKKKKKDLEEKIGKPPSK